MKLSKLIIKINIDLMVLVVKIIYQKLQGRAYVKAE